MPITIIDKLKQPNGLTFKILDSVDVEHTYTDDENVEQSVSLSDYLDELDERIGAGGVTIDNTLKVEGAAADAKAVGSAISNLDTLVGGKSVSSQISEAVDLKVDKVDGKGLSTNDYTTEEKNKLSGIEAGANKTVVDSALSTTSTNPVQNSVVATEINGLKGLVGNDPVSDQITSALASYESIYVQNEEPTDAQENSIWVDLDAESSSGGGSDVLDKITREITAINFVRTGTVIDVNYTLDNGDIVSSEITLDENDYPTKIVTDESECVISWEGF